MHLAVPSGQRWRWTSLVAVAASGRFWAIWWAAIRWWGRAPVACGGTWGEILEEMLFVLDLCFCPPFFGFNFFNKIEHATWKGPVEGRARGSCIVVYHYSTPEAAHSPCGMFYFIKEKKKKEKPC